MSAVQRVPRLDMAGCVALCMLVCDAWRGDILYRMALLVKLHSHQNADNSMTRAAKSTPHTPLPDGLRQALATARAAIRAATLADEPTALRELAAGLHLSSQSRQQIRQRTASWVQKIRRTSPLPGEALMASYSLARPEGRALMQLAEALVRVPDATTRDVLIADALLPHKWGRHFGWRRGLIVNLVTLGLWGAKLLLCLPLVQPLARPLVRWGSMLAMRLLGQEFVLGDSIEDALVRAAANRLHGLRVSFDMLGEAAWTHADAKRYFAAYVHAIDRLAKLGRPGRLHHNPGISVKLSALHPKYEARYAGHMLGQMVERVTQLALAASRADIGLTIDAEEMDRLDISLDIIAAVLANQQLAGWDGFGVVVQSYGKRACGVIDWLYTLAGQLDRRLSVRLVKGAYWDTEIKQAQLLGLKNFPVWTRKAHTDLAYLACANKLLGYADRLYPQFATHNAQTAAALIELADMHANPPCEFQRLHGMGRALHSLLMRQYKLPSRVYAPVGAHRDLLAYLVRRLLENGANSSFVNKISNPATPIDALLRDPLELYADTGGQPRGDIAMPAHMYPGRLAARGWNLNDPQDSAVLEQALADHAHTSWLAGPLSSSPLPTAGAQVVANPYCTAEQVGLVRNATVAAVAPAFDRATQAHSSWQAVPATRRAEMLRRIAEQYEAATPELLALLQREAGKTLLDGIGEIREAVDFLRYYANRVEALPPGCRARGVFVCISPWNFPLAIFTGQIAAALVTGNTVLAKPAEQTPLVAARAIELMYQAGIAADVVQLLPGEGDIGAALVASPHAAGVCFTGSSKVARHINLQLAKSAPHAPLIAETSGLNAMLVDSSALPEQAVRDVLASAFQSAGQRCSALRMLYVQNEIADALINMIAGGMDALVCTNPRCLACDVGPMIDEAARSQAQKWCASQAKAGRVLKALPEFGQGYGFAPQLIELRGIEDLPHEIFAPVLHVARFAAHQLPQVVAHINATGYGLTMGLHSRSASRQALVSSQAKVGNMYINRNQIGAVVGSQPFGGEGLSGTGPKAGGPVYLERFVQYPGTQSTSALPTEARLTDTQSTGEQSTSEQSTGKQSTDTQSVSEQSTGKQSVGMQSVSEQSTGKQSTGEQSTGEQSTGAANAVQAQSYRQLTSADLTKPLAGLRRLWHGQTLHQLHLPGPVGESNRLRQSGRGLVLCLGPGPALATAQARLAIDTGNVALVVHPQAEQAGLPAGVATLCGYLPPQQLNELDVDVVAFDGDQASQAAWRAQLAARPGALIALVSQQDGRVCWLRERSLSVDTTASGGNAELLASKVED